MIERVRPQTAELWQIAFARVETNGDDENTTFKVDTAYDSVSQVFWFSGPRTLFETSDLQGPNEAPAWIDSLNDVCSQTYRLQLERLSRQHPRPNISALSHYPQLRELSIMIELADEDLAKLAAAIPDMKELSLLEFAADPTNFDRMTDVARALRSTDSLETLSMSSPLHLEPEKIREFGSLLAGLPYLSSVTIRGCWYRPETGVEVLFAELLQSPSIQRLDTEVFFSDYEACKRAAELLGANTSLTELTFHGDVLYSHLFVEQLKRNHTLRELYFCDADVVFGDEPESVEVAEILNDNPSIIALEYAPWEFNSVLERVLDRNRHNLAQRETTLLSLAVNYSPPFNFRRISSV